MTKKQLLQLKPETMEMIKVLLKELEKIELWDCLLEDTGSTGSMVVLEKKLDKTEIEIYDASTIQNRGPTPEIIALSVAIRDLRDQIDDTRYLHGEAVDALKPYVENGEESE